MFFHIAERSALLVSSFSLLILLTSCGSFLRGDRKVINQKGSGQTVKTIPKAQYDQLLQKYEILLREKNKKSNVSIADPSQAIDNLKTPDLKETVDVFKKQGTANLSEKEVMIGTKVENVGLLTTETIEGQIFDFKKAIRLFDNKKFDLAISALKKLEGSKIKQIRVRAKYFIGEILFKDGEYDLAMQKYEEIINNYAFTSVVIRALKRLIVCSEKLNLSKKKERYHSILYDFFES